MTRTFGGLTVRSVSLGLQTLIHSQCLSGARGLLTGQLEVTSALHVGGGVLVLYDLGEQCELARFINIINQ